MRFITKVGEGMNYLRELNAFRNLALLNPFATGEVALWYSLMSINNMTSWREWFTVPNSTLQTLTGLSRQGLDRARNRLIQRELIEYKKGRSNQAGSYRIKSVCQKVGTAVDTVDDTVIDTPVAQQLTQSGHGSGTLLNKNKTKTKTSNKDIIPFDEIVDYLNQKTNQSYKPSTKQTRDLITARWNQGFRLDDFKTVIDKKTSDWLNDPKMCEYLRPITLFGTKFESYLNAKGVNLNGKREGSTGKGAATSGRSAEESITKGQLGWINRDKVQLSDVSGSGSDFI